MINIGRFAITFCNLCDTNSSGVNYTKKGVAYNMFGYDNPLPEGPAGKSFRFRTFQLRNRFPKVVHQHFSHFQGCRVPFSPDVCSFLAD